VHTGPLVRREKDYKNIDLTNRRKLFRHLFDFARVADIRYKTFVFKKREFMDHDALVSRMSRELGMFVRDNLAFFQSFDNLIVYYDGGQKEITTIINAVFNVLVDAEIRRVKPSDYCLFQAADLFCTLELVKFKLDEALAMLKTWDVGEFCAKDFHYPMTASAAELKELVRKTADAGVHLYGAGPITTKTEDDAKRAFDYCAALGVPTMVGVPAEVFDASKGWAGNRSSRKMCEVCARLADEYKIKGKIGNALHHRQPHQHPHSS
jgi:hypothetical protein